MISFAHTIYGQYSLPTLEKCPPPSLAIFIGLKLGVYVITLQPDESGLGIITAVKL